ncbi:hypothetical protein NEAUS03_0158 [Nematocida ausubeli]|nr:hypothetical protein NEAUS03_0158 [Nematocida ausubeli]
MVLCKVLSLLDITQPLLNHEAEKNKVPAIFKAVVEIMSNSETNQVTVVYIETNGIQIGINSILQYNNESVISLSKTLVNKTTQYRVNNDLITHLLKQKKAKQS